MGWQFAPVASDNGEKHLRLGFIEVRTQSKFSDLEIQTGMKWVPWRVEYRRIWNGSCSG